MWIVELIISGIEIISFLFESNKERKEKKNKRKQEMDKC